MCSALISFISSPMVLLFPFLFNCWENRVKICHDWAQHGLKVSKGPAP